MLSTNPFRAKILSVLNNKLEPMSLQPRPTSSSIFSYIMDYSPTPCLYLKSGNNVYDVSQEPLSYFNSVISQGFFLPRGITKEIYTPYGTLFLTDSHPTCHFAYSVQYCEQGYAITVLHSDYIPTGEYLYVKATGIIESKFSSTGKTISLPVIYPDGIVFQKVLL